MSPFIVTVDQGSSATKVLAFDHEGIQAYRSLRPLKMARPLPGHVEQDPFHVLEETRSALEEVLSSIDSNGEEIISIGLACQRSSFVFWDRKGGKAFTPIISWQDLRAKDICLELNLQREMIYQKTGLPLTGHYGGPKFLWFLRNDPEIPKLITQPGILFSPWNSFLLWHLTEEKACATDESVAGRTLFFNIHERCWDRELLDLFEIPEQILPEVWPTSYLYGHYRFRNKSIPIVCFIGDHQAALFGLGGFEKGQCGLNYGTSAGVLINIGSTPHIVKGLLTSILYSTKSLVRYTVEGTVNAVGSLFEWFGKEKGMGGSSIHWEKMMAPSSRGWFMLPGMYGIAAPYWRETVPVAFKGKGNPPPHAVLLRAGMESIAFFVTDILDQLRRIPGLEMDRITAAGGAARPPLLQFQADLLGLPILHASIVDATAFGCALLTGLQIGFWKEGEIRQLFHGDQTFYPQISPSECQNLLNGWHQFLKDQGIWMDQTK